MSACRCDRVTLHLQLFDKSTFVRWGSIKLVYGSQVGQVGPVDSCGQVADHDPSLVNSRNLSWVGQVGQVEFGGQVRNLDPSAPFCEP